MTVIQKIAEAILRDKTLRTILIKKCGLNEKSNNLEAILQIKNLEESLVSTLLEEYLDFTLEYPHPINTLAQVMNPIKIVGIKGAYLVIEDYVGIRTKFTLFSKKTEALSYGKFAYQSFLVKTNLKNKSKGLKPYRN